MNLSNLINLYFSRNHQKAYGFLMVSENIGVNYNSLSKITLFHTWKIDFCEINFLSLCITGKGASSLQSSFKHTTRTEILRTISAVTLFMNVIDLKSSKLLFEARLIALEVPVFP